MYHEEPIKNVTPDPRGRIALGLEVTQNIDFFKLLRAENGDLILRPHIGIPERELWLLNDKNATASLARSMEEAKQGDVAPLDPRFMNDEGDD